MILMNFKYVEIRVISYMKLIRYTQMKVEIKNLIWFNHHLQGNDDLADDVSYIHNKQRENTHFTIVTRTSERHFNTTSLASCQRNTKLVNVGHLSYNLSDNIFAIYLFFLMYLYSKYFSNCFWMYHDIERNSNVK